MALPSNANFNLESFRARVRSFSRPAYFLVEIPMVAVSENETLTALCRSTSMPGLDGETIEIPFQGMPIKYGGAHTYPDWSAQFLVDEGHRVRNLFLNWMNKVYDVSSMTANVPTIYKVDDTVVHQLSSDGQIVTSCNMVGLFPISVSEVGLDHSDTGFQTVDVTFSYDFFRIGDVGLSGTVTEILNIAQSGLQQGVQLAEAVRANVGDLSNKL